MVFKTCNTVFVSWYLNFTQADLYIVYWIVLVVIYNRSGHDLAWITNPLLTGSNSISITFYIDKFLFVCFYLFNEIVGA